MGTELEALVAWWLPMRGAQEGDGDTGASALLRPGNSIVWAFEPALPSQLRGARAELRCWRPCFMDEDAHWANVKVEPCGNGVFRAVLVFGWDDGEQDSELRISLAGHHPSVEKARNAARIAIKTLATSSDDFE